MPQFDFAFWSPQIVWLVISFVVLYFLMFKLAIPQITEIIEERENRIGDDIRKAEALKRDAEQALASYDKSIADARALAHDHVRSVRDKAAAEAAEHNARLNAKLEKELAAAEQGLARARGEAFGVVQLLATEIVEEAMQRLIGERPDATRQKKVVNKVIGESRL